MVQPADRPHSLFGPGKDAGPPGPPAFAPLSFGHFLVEREVGRGRNSVVYRAVDPKDKATVALKVIYPGDDPAVQERWIRATRSEEKRLRVLTHPHIVGVRESGAIDHLPFIVFPFVFGVSLDKALSAGMLGRSEALLFMAKTARAVHHAHQCGLIHRDLKSLNIILGSDGQPHVLDFGLSWIKGEKSEAGIQSIVGTPAYMSPEQARGEEEHLTPATDVYSLGAILYEILTGRPPFAAETSWKTLQQVMGVAPTPPRKINSTIDVDCERVVLWCLEKDPHKRYPTAEALAESLDLLAQHKPPHAPRTLFGRLFHH